MEEKTLEIVVLQVKIFYSNNLTEHKRLYIIGAMQESISDYTVSPAPDNKPKIRSKVAIIMFGILVAVGAAAASIIISNDDNDDDIRDVLGRYPELDGEHETDIMELAD